MFLFNSAEIRYRDTLEQPWVVFAGVRGIVEVRQKKDEAPNVLVFRTSYPDACYVVTFSPAGSVAQRITPCCFVCGRFVGSAARFTGRCRLHAEANPAEASTTPRIEAPPNLSRARAYFADEP